MLYTRRKTKKPQPNWTRIILTVLALFVIGLSTYFLSEGLRGPEGAKPQSLAPEEVNVKLPDEEASPAPQESPAAATPAPAKTNSPAPQTTPTATPATPTPPPLTGQRRMTFGAVGDIVSGEFMLKAAKTGNGYDYTEMFKRMQPYLEMQDYTLANIGSAIADDGKYGESAAPVQLLDALKAAGFDALSLACEHSLDGGVEGAMETAGLVKDMGLEACGVYASSADYAKPLILEGQDLRVALLSYTEKTLQTPDGAADVVKYLDDAALKADMEAIHAEEKGVDFVIAMVHWGDDKASEVTDAQKQWAQKLADAGVDVILGANKQLQPLEEIQAQDGRKTLVAYSLGNFLTQVRTGGRDASAVLSFTLMKDFDSGKTAIESVRYTPSWILRYSIVGKYHFEILPVHEFREKRYENLAPEARTRMLQATQEVQTAFGTTVARLDETVPAPPEG